MTPRQLWLFQFGCWAALVTAAVHLVGWVVSPLPGRAGPDSAALQAAAAAVVRFPDGTERALGGVVAGFSLAYGAFLATLGGVGLAAARRGRDRSGLMADVARVLALASLALLVISLIYFFLASTMLLAVTLICFTLAAVRPPE